MVRQPASDKACIWAMKISGGMRRPFDSCPDSESGTILWYIRIGTWYSR
jgi:hypothetical protein